MKIVGVDNFDREGPGHDDILVCENVDEYYDYGNMIVEMLNNRLSGNNSPHFFRLVPDDYKLYVFEP